MKKITSLLLVFCFLCLGEVFADERYVTVTSSNYCFNGDTIVLSSHTYHFIDPKYQWQTKINSNDEWQNISAANSASYKIPVLKGDTAIFYRVLVQEQASCPDKDKKFYSNIVCITSCGDPLALTIEQFSGKIENQQAVFTFKVNDYDKLYLQISSDAIKFVDLAELKGNFYIDKTIVGQKFYRLRAVSSIEGEKYSDVIRLENGINFNKNFQISILTTDGKIIKKETLSGIKENIAELMISSTKDLKRGVYILVFYQDGKVVDRKKYGKL